MVYHAQANVELRLRDAVGVQHPAVVGHEHRVGGGLVVVGSRSLDGGVYAFPAVCTRNCRPVWVGDTGGPTAGVTIAGGTAFTVARGQLMAFPMSCRDSCVPAWTSPFLPGGPFATPAARGGVVFVVSRTGRFTAIVDSCPSQPSRCGVAWSG